MSGLINFIKSLFSGIFGFVGGLLGGKKKSEAIAEGEAKSARKKGNSGFFLELDDSKDGAPAQASSPAPAETANGATAEAKPAKSSRKEKLAALAQGNQPAATPAPAKAATATAAPPAAKPAAVLPPETAFATKYLISNGNNSRRRPGANMSPYLDMARKIKVG